MFHLDLDNAFMSHVSHIKSDHYFNIRLPVSVGYIEK